MGESPHTVTHIYPCVWVPMEARRGIGVPRNLRESIHLHAYTPADEIFEKDEEVLVLEELRY